ncbi:hypothetical protein TNCV_4928051 [Trichonephila clavipes]|nr:hypothetical protein TNCV_4928051 [Trichonephila clavipes]
MEVASQLLVYRNKTCFKNNEVLRNDIEKNKGSEYYICDGESNAPFYLVFFKGLQDHGTGWFLSDNSNDIRLGGGVGFPQDQSLWVSGYRTPQYLNLHVYLGKRGYPIPKKKPTFLMCDTKTSQHGGKEEFLSTQNIPLECVDEAHFWLKGYVNKQNCHIWSEANPQVYVETPLHPEKLTVWCALWAGGILLQKR